MQYFYTLYQSGKIQREFDVTQLKLLFRLSIFWQTTFVIFIFFLNETLACSCPVISATHIEHRNQNILKIMSLLTKCTIFLTIYKIVLYRIACATFRIIQKCRFSFHYPYLKYVIIFATSNVSKNLITCKKIV